MKSHDASSTENAGTTDPAASAVEPAAETGEVAGILSGGQESEEAPAEAPEPAQEGPGTVIGTPAIGAPAIGAESPTAAPEAATDPKPATTSTSTSASSASVAEPEPVASATPATPAPAAPGEVATEAVPATQAAAGTGGGGDGAAVTAGATATVASGSGDGSTPPSGEADPDDSRRLSRPMVAAAALAGLLLVASPFVIQAVTRHSDGDSSTAARAAAYQGETGDEGFVPGVQATPEAKGKKGSGAGSGDGKSTSGGTGDSGKVSGAGSVPGSDNAPGPEGATKAGAAGKATGGDTSAKGSEPSSAPSAPASSTSNSSSTSSGSGSSSSNSASGSGAKTAVKAPPATYSATGGPHCSSGSYFEVGSSAGGDDAWTTHPGGYSSGCTGVFRSLPLSGNGSDAGNSAYWLFRTGKVTKGSCTVLVHIPSDTNRKHVGGTSAYYTLHDGKTGSGSSQLTGYTINQPSHLGQWVQLPKVKITGGVLTLKLHDRGTESTSDAHVAADAAKASCTAS
ncbi:hypothetical protein [Streptomyces sp. NPDC001770]